MIKNQSNWLCRDHYWKYWPLITFIGQHRRKNWNSSEIRNFLSILSSLTTKKLLCALKNREKSVSRLSYSLTNVRPILLFVISKDLAIEIYQKSISYHFDLDFFIWMEKYPGKRMKRNSIRITFENMNLVTGVWMLKNPPLNRRKAKNKSMVFRMCGVRMRMIYCIIAFEWTINNSALLQFAFESNKSNIWSKWVESIPKKNMISLLDDHFHIAIATEIDVRCTYEECYYFASHR